MVNIYIPSLEAGCLLTRSLEASAKNKVYETTRRDEMRASTVSKLTPFFGCITRRSNDVLGDEGTNTRGREPTREAKACRQHKPQLRC